MSVGDIGIHHDGQSDGWVHGMMASSIASAVATAGLVDGLAPLQWTVQVEGRDILITGTPTAETTHPVALCRAWAAVLELQECDYDDVEDVLAWNRAEGPWLLEISTRRL
ncbi:hypothetical protein HD599_000112 [Conyzicola lurida]|uniref:Uncharacterized protein n=2 Tax=Conyzicola lurida TaxID=1172621 RepID=A0A841AK15_9MICO|nr:hypothetical protein [Conyzicola lurida]